VPRDCHPSRSLLARWIGSSHARRRFASGISTFGFCRTTTTVHTSTTTRRRYPCSMRCTRRSQTSWKRASSSDGNYAVHKEFVRRIEALGLPMHVAEEHRIWNLNTPRIPQGVDDAAVRKTLLEQDGIEILGGFGQLAGKVFRIGVMGPLATTDNLDFFFDRFSRALAIAGYKVPAGVAH